MKKERKLVATLLSWGGLAMALSGLSLVLLALTGTPKSAYGGDTPPLPVPDTTMTATAAPTETPPPPTETATPTATATTVPLATDTSVPLATFTPIGTEVPPEIVTPLPTEAVVSGIEGGANAVETPTTPPVVSAAPQFTVAPTQEVAGFVALPSTGGGAGSSNLGPLFFVGIALTLAGLGSAGLSLRLRHKA